MTRTDDRMSEPDAVGSGLLAIAESMRADFAAGTFGACAALVAPENYCSHGKHGIALDMGVGQFLRVREIRPCPVHAATADEKRRREILTECPLVVKIAARYGVEFTPARLLWAQLLGAMDADRSVTWTADGRGKKPLSSLLELVERGCRVPAKQAPHLLFQGPCGTGKTTLQAVLYLAACEAGFAAAFVDSIELRTLATNLNSRFTPTADAADKRMDWLCSRDVLCWSDVGDTNATHREFAETVTALLERFNGRLIMSSNLDPETLSRHPDIGERAISRMLAGRHGKSSIVIEIRGQDQRKHGTPLQAVMEL